MRRLASTLSRRPDQIVILLDDVGIGTTDTYSIGGGTKAHTPNLSALAAAGVRFTNAYAHPLCSPTRAALMEGRYSHHTGIGKLVLDDETEQWNVDTQVTGVTRLLHAGYHTSAFGKWHLHNMATWRDAPYLDAGYEHVELTERNIGGQSDYLNYDLTINGIESPGSYGQYHDRSWASAQRRGTYATVEFTLRALEWIKWCKSRGSRRRPYFCYLPYHAAHVPHHRPPGGLYNASVHNLPNEEPVGAEDPRPYYLAMIEAWDYALGLLLDEVDLSETVVWVIGDNGAADSVIGSPWPAGHDKGTVYQGGILVPAVVAGPRVQAGVDLGMLTADYDVMPTLLDWAGANPEGAEYSFDGKSIAVQLEDVTAEDPRKEVFLHDFVPNNASSHPTSQYELALIQDRTATEGAEFKRRQGLNIAIEGPEFFDLTADPFEETELVAGGLTTPQQTAFDAMGTRISTLLSS